MEYVPHGLLPYAKHHFIEHVEAHVAVRNNGVLLAQRLQAYALAQLIHCVYMIHPVRINCLQQHHALHFAHVYARAGYFRFLLGIQRVNKLMRLFLKRLAVGDAVQLAREVRTEQLVKLAVQRHHVPFVGGSMGACALVKLCRNAFVHHFHYGIVNIFAHEHAAALRIDYFAHLIHNVVILKHVLSYFKVMGFNALLCVLNLL